jgi:hypothetical protein
VDGGGGCLPGVRSARDPHDPRRRVTRLEVPRFAVLPPQTVPRCPWDRSHGLERNSKPAGGTENSGRRRSDVRRANQSGSAISVLPCEGSNAWSTEIGRNPISVAREENVLHLGATRRGAQGAVAGDLSQGHPAATKGEVGFEAPAGAATDGA